MSEEITPPIFGVDATRQVLLEQSELQTVNTFNQFSVQIETMHRMHAQKVRTLMTSIHMLKEQLAVAKAASKEHRRFATDSTDYSLEPRKILLKFRVSGLH
jgi:hypothetical protein